MQSDIADRDLAQCRTPHLSPDWQLNIAYNAALQAATAALAAAGYRAARDAHHYRVIQSLAHTIEADPALILQLDKFRKKRNITEYEQAGAAPTPSKVLTKSRIYDILMTANAFIKEFKYG